MIENIEIDLKNLRHFEKFLKSIGFKRIEGSIYGLLILSSEPLSSDEIQKKLGLSQAAVSNAIKMLNYYSAVETNLDHNKGCRVYESTQDCISVVSNVLQKREALIVKEYKKNIQSILNDSLMRGMHSSDKRAARLKSIISTCELGESIIGFTTSLDTVRFRDNLVLVTEKLPQVFQMIISGAEIAQGSAEILKDKVGGRLKNYLKAFKGEERGQ